VALGIAQRAMAAATGGLIIPEIDIDRLARRKIERHGDAAVAKVRERVEEARRKDDEQEADVWLRVLVALGTRSGARGPI
jgi:hypothetical protein